MFRLNANGKCEKQCDMNGKSFNGFSQNYGFKRFLKTKIMCICVIAILFLAVLLVYLLLLLLCI